MRTALRCLGLVFLATVSKADLLVPSTVPISTTVFADTILSTSGPHQFQQYIAPGEYNPTQAIFGLQLKLRDGVAAWPVSDVQFSSFTILAGPASAALDASHGVFDPAVPFANNFESPVTTYVVYSGSLTIPANSFQPGD